MDYDRLYTIITWIAQRGIHVDATTRNNICEELRLVFEGENKNLKFDQQNATKLLISDLVDLVTMDTLTSEEIHKLREKYFHRGLISRGQFKFQDLLKL